MKKFDEQIKELIVRMKKDIDEGKLVLPIEMKDCLVYLIKQEQKLNVKQNELKFTPQVGMVWFQEVDYSFLVSFMVNDYLSKVYDLPASWFTIVGYSIYISNGDIKIRLLNTDIQVGGFHGFVPYTCAFNEGQMLGLVDKNEKCKYDIPDYISEALKMVEELEVEINLSNSHAFTLA